MNIAFIGNFQIKKGSQLWSDMVLEIAEDQEKNQHLQTRFYIFGHIQDTENYLRIEKYIEKQSSYNYSDLESLLSKYNVDVAITPSIWPETFMMTFFQLATIKCPIIAPNIGFPFHFLQQTEYPLFFSLEEERSLVNLVKTLTPEVILKAQIILNNSLNDSFWRKQKVKYEVIDSLLLG